MIFLSKKAIFLPITANISSLCTPASLSAFIRRILSLTNNTNNLKSQFLFLNSYDIMKKIAWIIS